MKAAWLVLAAIALAAHGQTASVSDPVIQIDYSNPGLSPPEWTMTLHADGSGHFRSQTGKAPASGLKQIEVPSMDRDIEVSAEFAGRVFDVAQRHHWFNDACESHLKVAFQGWKTLTYTGPRQHGACTFNYSKDKDIQTLGDSMQAVAETILEGARLQLLLQHDPLGLDQEMDYLTEAVHDGRAQQVCVIRSILERLAQDDGVLDRVRKRARELLAHDAS